MGLTAIGIKRAADGRHGDGGGLELHKAGDGGKWIWRYTFARKRRQMGLGSWPVVTLAEARKERDRWAAVLARGDDPITARKIAKEEARAALERIDPTLEALAVDVFEARKETLRGAGKAGRWLSPLAKHVLPKIGHKPISKIHQTDVKAALSPIWKTQHPTAEKAIQRLRIIFRQGKLMGYECDPFTIDAAEHMLGHVAKATTPIPATPWQDIPALFQRYDNRGVSPSCLQFLMLTVVRVSAARGARYDEIDGDVWTVPAERMKGRVGKVQDFRVPLSPAALAIIERRRQLGGEYIFANSRGKPVSDSALSKFMREQGEHGRPHGFRTSFRSWVQDSDACTYDVAETILAHLIGNKIERTYARSDLLERRRPVMSAWGDFVTSTQESKVVTLRG